MTQVMGNGHFLLLLLDPCTVLAEANLHSPKQVPDMTQKPAQTKSWQIGGISQFWRLRDLKGGCRVQQLGSGTEHGLQLLSYMVQAWTKTCKEMKGWKVQHKSEWEVVLHSLVEGPELWLIFVMQKEHIITVTKHNNLCDNHSLA